MKIFLFVFATLGVVVSSAWAELPYKGITVQDMEAISAIGAGDASQLEATVERFEEALKQNAGDPILTAYLGMLRSLEANEAFFPWSRLSLGEKATSMLNKALKLSRNSKEIGTMTIPAELEVKILSAIIFLTLPNTFFGTEQQGKDLAVEVLDHPSFEETADSMKSALYFIYAQRIQEEQPQETLVFAQKIIEMNVEPLHVEKARELLDN